MNKVQRLCASYRKYEAAKKLADAVKNAKYNLERQQQTDNILKICKKLEIRVDLVEDNYCFYASYRKFYLHFCNQSSRLVGEFYKLPISSDEKDIQTLKILSKKGRWLESEDEDLYAQFIDVFQYESICINGEHTEALTKIVRKINCMINSHSHDEVTFSTIEDFLDINASTK